MTASPAISAADEALGDIFLQRRLITLAQLDEARALAVRWAVRLGDVLLARDWMSAAAYYRTLSAYFDLPFVDLDAEPPEPALFGDPSLADVYARRLIVPWRRRGGRLLAATADPGPQAVLEARRLWGADVDLVVASRAQILAAIQHAFRERQSHQAVFELAEMDPEMSARQVFAPSQIAFLYGAISALAMGLMFAPLATVIAVNLALGLFYLGNFLFKAVLVWAGGRGQAASSRALEAEARLLTEAELPTYTILVPMFREPDVLPILAHALRSLDYPLAKLDIKIVLEEGDRETIEAAEALGLEGIFEIIQVPPSHPQTKPKACNYALRYARGEFLVIYDAEDKPEPDQLRKVVAAFRRSPASTACVQCRLNYYNPHENWLTRMFTLDYALWFDLMLPGLERLGAPIPLGGTSNHFRIDVLRDLHAWDAFNVTEDADLGIRLTQKGYRCRVIDSTTFEEANCRAGNWVRQRSRWIKGYMQTFLVHTRRPVHLVRSVGFLGTVGFVFFIGGTMLSGLVNPVFWLIFAAWLGAGATGLDAVFPPAVLAISLFNLLAGNGLLIWLTLIAPFRRRWLELAPLGLTVVGYWVLLSIAAYKALWQLLANPFYWEKTQHGISSHTAAQLKLARANVAPA